MKRERGGSTAERECGGWKVVDPFECEVTEGGYLDEGPDDRFFSSREFIPVTVRYLNGGEGRRVAY